MKRLRSRGERTTRRVSARSSIPTPTGPGGTEPDTLAVGWLDEHHEFTKGAFPEHLLKRVLALCFTPVNQTRGYHLSPFLLRDAHTAPSTTLGYLVEHGGRTRLLGSAEIRVPGAAHVRYAAPDLIFHYIKDCSYLPPREFVDALERMRHVD